MAVGVKHNIPKSLKDPLKPSQQAEPREESKPACASDSNGSPCWASGVGLIILAANCAAAVYHSRDDPWAVAFVLCCFAILLSLFCMLRVFEISAPGSSSRAHAKAAVWVLSTALTLMFSARVAALMPFPAAVVVWVMAGSTICAGFFMFFLCPEDAADATAEKEPAKVAGIDIA